MLTVDLYRGFLSLSTISISSEGSTNRSGKKYEGPMQYVNDMNAGLSIIFTCENSMLLVQHANNQSKFSSTSQRFSYPYTCSFNSK